MKPLRSHRELHVYQLAAQLRQRVFFESKNFPADERFELTAQWRRCSRSVCAAIAEAWRKRNYRAYWISKLSDAGQEAAESQTWAETAVECGYIADSEFEEYWDAYDKVLAQLTIMSVQADKWTRDP